MEANRIIYDRFGDPTSVLKVERTAVEAPQKQEVLVRMIARPINPSDLIPMTGAYAHRIALPAIPGYEGVGVIEEVGSSVSSQWIGQRVLPLRGEGTWQEVVKTSIDFVVPIPPTIDDFIAAQLYINPLSAWVICTEVLKIQVGEALLVNACGSAIGRIFVQLAKLFGFRLIAVVRSGKQTEQLLQLGASHVIDTSQASLLPAVMELTNGRGAKHAIDSIGGEEGTQLAACLQPGGQLLTIGLLSGEQINWSNADLQTSIAVKLFHLRHWNERVSVRYWQETFRRVIKLVHDQKLCLSPPERCYDLLDVHVAVRAAAQRTSGKGKLFLLY